MTIMHMRGSSIKFWETMLASLGTDFGKGDRFWQPKLVWLDKFWQQNTPPIGLRDQFWKVFTLNFLRLEDHSLGGTNFGGVHISNSFANNIHIICRKCKKYALKMQVCNMDSACSHFNNHNQVEAQTNISS